MVRSATSNSSLNTTKKFESKPLIIEEKSTKPPGIAKFSRRNEVKEEITTFFKNDVLTTVSELCQQLLVSGFVQSYVDFYHLTHRVDPNLVEEKGEIQIKTSVDDMTFIRDQLVKAEMSRRQGDTASVYVAFNKLADYYVTNRDWKTSFFFHEKCLEVAQLTNDARGEMSANHSLGCIYQLMHDYEGARSFHEKHEEIAVSIDVFEEIAKSNVELYKVYLVLAERYESAANTDEALQMYFKCLESAKKSWDRAAEGEANGRIGNLLLLRNEAQQCLPYLRQQSQIAADLGQAEGRCKACTALALALDMLGQSEKALTELTLVHTISEQAGDTYLQAQACKALGTLYSKLGKLDSAVEILQRHFNLLKTILYRSSNADKKSSKEGSGLKAKGVAYTVTSQDIDLARAYIGISKGNLLLGSYVMTLQCDLISLLDWKLNRTDLPKLSTLQSKLDSILMGDDADDVRLLDGIHNNTDAAAAKVGQQQGIEEDNQSMDSSSGNV